MTPEETPMVLLRDELGTALRARRRDQGLTLREVGLKAAVSAGYISEVERGAKEPSSETLDAICGALGVPLSTLLVDVAERAAVAELAHLVVAGASVDAA